ncbi:MAG: M23 family metallopeptidase [Clostridium sp.]
MILIFILLLALFSSTMFYYLGENPCLYQLTPYTWETEPFRDMKLGGTLTELEHLNYEQIAALMIHHNFDLTNCKDLSYHNQRIILEKAPDYKKLANAYQVILKDLKYFPIPDSTKSDTPKTVYDNSWKEQRNYGGTRSHEGCDIMGSERERGFYPVVSISDGVVEKIGWLEKGGWRLGIRTQSGTYLYYAHLYRYSQDFKEGDVITAGQLIGYMGDSGYGKVENTIGNFDVHLHLGIYIKTDHYEELSINPYWILRYLEKNKLHYYY